MQASGLQKLDTSLPATENTVFKSWFSAGTKDPFLRAFIDLPGRKDNLCILFNDQILFSRLISFNPSSRGNNGFLYDNDTAKQSEIHVWKEVIYMYINTFKLFTKAAIYLNSISLIARLGVRYFFICSLFLFLVSREEQRTF